VPPWLVKNCSFKLEEKRLDIYIDFPSGSSFTCPGCGRLDCKAYDTSERTWRHLNFFEHVTYITARLPRVECPHCGVQTVTVPWARDGSGFTLLFEAFIMTLAKEMPVNAIARMVTENDTRLWRILQHYVDNARRKQDYSQVYDLGVDEKSRSRGHKYISIFVDMDQSKVIFATEGKDAATIKSFKEDFQAHNGKSEKIQEACCDMSPAFISGLGEALPNAHITFDKFHVMKIINEAVDKVRRQEQQNHPELKKSRYLWLKNQKNLTEKEKKKFDRLKYMNLDTARAYHIKLNFQQMYNQSKEMAEAYLKKWYFWATHSRLKPIIDAAKTIKRHWNGILRWFKSRLNNGVLEGLNSLIQAAKAKARGYRTTKNLITMVYIIAGKLDFCLPI
jgi:transposase